MQAQAVAGRDALWCRICHLPARCVQSGLEMHRKEQSVAISHPDIAELQHHWQGRTKALGVSGKVVSTNSDSPTINPVGLWSFKVQQYCLTTLQFQICFTNTFLSARTMGSLLECGMMKISNCDGYLVSKWNIESHPMARQCCLMQPGALESSMAKKKRVTQNPFLSQSSNMHISCHPTATTVHSAKMFK